MGCNMNSDLGDFLKWEAQHAFGPGYYGAHWCAGRLSDSPRFWVTTMMPWQSGKIRQNGPIFLSELDSNWGVFVLGQVSRHWVCRRTSSMIDFERAAFHITQYPHSLTFLTCYDTSREPGRPAHIGYIRYYILLYTELYTYIYTIYLDIINCRFYIFIVSFLFCIIKYFTNLREIFKFRLLELLFKFFL
jgi:hypothetical protein